MNLYVRYYPPIDKELRARRRLTAVSRDEVSRSLRVPVRYYSSIYLLRRRGLDEE